MKKILVTGAGGFIGKNIVSELKNRNYPVLEYKRDTPEQEARRYIEECDFVIHLAGINRPPTEAEFMEGNYGFTRTLTERLKKAGNPVPILMTSSIQAELDNAYGRSKYAAEEELFAYQQESGAEVFVYRLPNVFGKWCRPGYNSAVATFCHHIARDMEIQVNDRETSMLLVYIDDVTAECIKAVEGRANRIGRYCAVPVTHQTSLGRIADLIQGFREMRNNLTLPDMGDELEKKLYSTYLSYLPEDGFSYPLKPHVDSRGSFTEFIRTPDRGQVSVNVSKAGITKGEHWHHTKNEKFLVVKGSALIRFRQIGSSQVIEYPVSAEKPEVVDIPTGYTHHIVNTGDEELITLMWANEAFDPERPDTYPLRVEEKNE